MFNKDLIQTLIRTNKAEIDYWREEMDKLTKDRNNIVFCEECGVAIKKDKAKVVIKEKQLIHYCDRHAPDYDRIEYNLLVGGSNKYYKDNVKVDVKGRIIKNKK